MTERRVWFVSDTHFGHDRIREYTRPQFGSVAEMDECMITRWRETVGPHDLVYHLGDFALKPAHAAEVRRKLTGTIRLIVGNHDDVPRLVREDLFQAVQMWRIFPEYGFVASHVPLRRGNLRYGCAANVCGHMHGNDADLDDFHRDVSVEVTDYRPVAAEELARWASRFAPAETSDTGSEEGVC